MTHAKTSVERGQRIVEALGALNLATADREWASAEAVAEHVTRPERLTRWNGYQDGTAVAWGLRWAHDDGLVERQKRRVYEYRLTDEGRRYV